MKVNGRHAVNSYSSRGSGSACFWRRRYALEPPSASNGASGSRGGRGGAHQTVVWGDQLVHYLDDEEARGFARRSPFGAAGVARPLTSEECWRGRGAQLPPDGNLFLPVSRRESRREDLAVAAAGAAAVAAKAAAANAAANEAAKASSGEKSLSLSVKQEDDGFLGGVGGGWGCGGTGKVAPGVRRYGGGGGGGGGGGVSSADDVVRRLAVPNPTVWGGTAPAAGDMYSMNGNGHVGEGGSDVAGIGAAMPSPATTRLGGAGGAGGGGGGGGGGATFWDVKKGMESQQQQAPSNLNPTGFCDDDIGGLGMKCDVLHGPRTGVMIIVLAPQHTYLQVCKQQKWNTFGNPITLAVR